MELEETSAIVLDAATRVGLEVLGAIVLWIIGRMFIGLAGRMLRLALDRQRVDTTLFASTLTTPDDVRTIVGS